MTSSDRSPASIASSVLTQFGCGSSRCPLVIDVTPGQRLNVTMRVFRNVSDVTSTTCQHLLSVKRLHNNEMRVVREVTSCAGDARSVSFSLSESGRLFFDVTTPVLATGRPRFLMTYHGGCSIFVFLNNCTSLMRVLLDLCTRHSAARVAAL